MYTKKCPTGQTECISLVVVVRTVAAGHTMIAYGHKTVAEGWRLFEEAVDELMPKDLPPLAIKGENDTNTTPITHGPWPSYSTKSSTITS